MSAVVVFWLVTGETLVTAGADVTFVTVNPVTSIPSRPVVVLVTTTLYWPVSLFVKSNVVVMFVEETTNTVPPLISANPDRFSLTVLPVIKFVPDRFVMLIVDVFCPVAGVMPLTVGAAAGVMFVTVKPLPNIPKFPSGLVTTTLYRPGR